MSFSPKLNINNHTLKWARENAGFDINDIHNIELKRIEELEKGTDRPTLKEANILAELYGVSSNVFYFPPPKKSVLDIITDFRQFHNTKNKKYSKELRLLINKLQERQKWLKEYFEEEKIKPLSFVSSVKINSTPQKIADKIVKTFFSSRDNYLKFHREEKLRNNKPRLIKKSKDRFLLTLIEKLGSYGVVVVKCRGFNNENSIELQEARGFILSDKYAPFIFLHSKDYITAQIFTLIHELTHLFINESGVIGELQKKHLNKIEKFCNQVASRFLLTENQLKAYFDSKKKNTKRISKEEIVNNIDKVSKKFFISKLSVLLRLKEQKIIKDNLFNQLWNEFYTEMQGWIAKKDKKLLEEKQSKDKKPRGNFYNTMLSRTNKDFIKVVYSAYQAKSITGYQASSLLNIKVDNFKNLMSHIRKQA